jgi:hypothetical protein
VALLDLLVGPVMDIVNKLIPDPQAKMQFQIQLLQLQQNTEFKELDNQLAMAQSQTDTNKVEASNTNLFVAGWRPFIGWICGSTLAYTYILANLINILSAVFGHPLNLPKPDMSEMMPILLGMLGLGGMRTYEKVNGINAGH